MPSFKTFKETIQKKGLLICQQYKLDPLPPSILDFFNKHSIQYQNLHFLIIGNAQKSFWKNFGHLSLEKKKDPLDYHITQFIREELERAHIQVKYELYPNKQLNFPLNSLINNSSLASPSKLGISIHPTYGLWWAVRYLAMIEEQNGLEHLSPIGATHDLCSQCQSMECISACPAQAVLEKNYLYNICKGFRLLENGPCRNTCLSRRACPINRDEQYPKEQESYHMLRSLNVLKKL